jgi:FKBP-type peptidyl-prolyl cis-trans isomerase FkpA
MLKQILISLAALVFFSGCLKHSDSTGCTTVYDPCAYKAPASEIQAVQDYLTSNGISATQHCSGLFYTIDNPGTGATPNICSDITVTYEGRLTNGTVFGSTSTAVALNLSRVIAGWANGLPLIKAGGSMHLYIPPTLGYGATASGPIPPNSILIFQVGLVTVQ